MTSQITFLGHDGTLLDSFPDLPTTPRSWILNKYGRCEFSVPYDHPACKEQLLRFGNLVHIQHLPTEDGSNQNGSLPSWTGVILTPRTWTRAALNVVAYSLEAILAYRAVPYVNGVTGSPDAVFKELLDYANRDVEGVSMLHFLPGQIDPSPLVFTDDLRTNAYDHMVKLANFANMEFSCEGKIEGGIFKAYAHLKARPASATGAVLSIDNTEQQDPILTEQGVPWNMIFAYTQSNTAADRVSLLITNPSSINAYGPFQINQVYLGVHDAAGLNAAAQAQSETRGQVQRVFKRVALDVGKTFDYLRPGNLLEVDEPRAGFNVDGSLGFRTMIRILSMDYNDTSNKVSLNVELATAMQSSAGSLQDVAGI